MNVTAQPVLRRILRTSTHVCRLKAVNPATAAVLARRALTAVVDVDAGLHWSLLRHLPAAVDPDNLSDVTNFDGKTCVDTYLAKFESCAEYNNWTVRDKAAHLKSALTGNAANLLQGNARATYCLLYTSPSPRDRTRSRMPSSA